MDQVDWGESVSIKKVERRQPEIHHKQWIELCKPTTSREIRGNRECVETISDWFNHLQCSSTATQSSNSPCLFIHGPSGVWKSTAVVLCGSEHGFNVVHTHSDVPRTPQKLDAFLRQVGLGGGRGVLLLDEFESFIKETTSLKWLSRLVHSAKFPVVVISNALDKCFYPIRDVSTVVEFKPYSTTEMYSTLLRLSSKVSGFCHLPPMDCYFISTMCSGNVFQTVNQVQMLYYGSPVLQNKNKKRKKLGKVQGKCMQDSSMKMWSNSHRATSVDCFVDRSDLLESVAEMNREFMTGLGFNLWREYPLYFHNSTLSTLSVVASCADNLSAANCGLGSEFQEQDRMYESQNSAQWSEDNINFIARVTAALLLLRDRKKNAVERRRKTVKKVFKYY